MANDLRDIVSLLEAAGSVKLKSGAGHIRYRLPNGNNFTTGSTPTRPSSFANAMSVVRRELRTTHPELAETRRSFTLPKNKRHTSNTIGEIINAKVSPFAAIPGSEPVPLPEAEFALEVPEPEVHVYQPSRKVAKDPPPKPGMCRTLPQEQLDKANFILRVEGAKAMNDFLNGHRNELVMATPALIEQRFAEPVRVPARPHQEENEMTTILERARRELESTTARIKAHEAAIATAQAMLDADVLKQTSLEEYVKEHETLASKAVTILELLPPEEKVAPPAPVPAPAKSESAYYKLKHLREFVLPKLTGSFSVEQYRAAVHEAWPAQTQPAHMSAYKHLQKMVEKGWVERVSTGFYQVVQP
jgi:hypothetical protein